MATASARDFLEGDLTIAKNVIKDTITVDLTQAQFDALVSYVYNSGGEPNSPYDLKGIPELINSGNYQGAADAIASGPNTTGDPPVTLDIPVERRQAEANLFLNGIYVP